MSYPINYPTPQSANFQAFYGGGTTQDWVKPQGASMVRMLLIGAGSGGAGGTTSAQGNDGASGAVTEWIGPAMFIPDVLRVVVGRGGAEKVGGGGSTGNAGTATSIVYQAKDGTGYTLLTANAGSATTPGAASSNNYFGAAGIFNSIAGHRSGTGAVPTTTFLCGGGGGGSPGTAAGYNASPAYGYTVASGGAGTTGGKGADGYFLTQPIMVGCGGAGGGGSSTGAGGNGGNGGIGCGGGGGGRCTSGTSIGGRGGDGAVFIWSW